MSRNAGLDSFARFCITERSPAEACALQRGRIFRPSPAIHVLIALLGLTLSSGCSGRDGTQPTVLRFWAMGREGEVVQELVNDFERANPDIHVQVQQIPWSAAHEKLLTAFVGRSTPDLAQLGNTWISEFSELGAITPLGTWLRSSSPLDSTTFFSGIWRTNVIDGVPLGVPWYVDTRILFYRRDILQKAGFDTMPTDWKGWRAAMTAIKRQVGPQQYAIFLPINEWSPLATLGLQAGSPLLRDHATAGAFAQPAFRRAFDFYLGLIRDGLAPAASNNEVANIYQEFARGYFSMYITGPWNLGEFARRLPAELQSAWATAVLPGPDEGVPGVSLAGGSSLVLFRRSPHQEQAWRLIHFLSQPEQQLRFYHLTGDLPARQEAWQDTAFTRDPRLSAFCDQLRRVVSTPKIPEWELIATRLQERAEMAARGAALPESALAALDRDVDRILEKRRWMLEHRRNLKVAGESRP